MFELKASWFWLYFNNQTSYWYINKPILKPPTAAFQWYIINNTTISILCDKVAKCYIIGWIIYISKNDSIIYGLVDHIMLQKSCTGPVQPYINFLSRYKTIYYWTWPENHAWSYIIMSLCMKIIHGCKLYEHCLVLPCMASCMVYWTADYQSWLEELAQLSLGAI